MLALVECGRLVVDDGLIDVDRELPAVLRMGLLDVDDQELNAVLVLLVDFVQAPGLLAEGRSGVGAEDQPHRTLVAEVGERNGRLAISERR